MRDVSAAFLAAVDGSNTPVVTVDIWHGGEIVRQGLRPAGGLGEWDASRDVEGRLDLVVMDPESTGSRLSETIHAIGMRANVRAGFEMAGTIETVSMGWFDLYDVHHTEAWEWFEWTDQAVKTSDLVTIQGLDFLSVVSASPFLEPTQPTAGADAWATIEELCLGIIQTNDPGLPSKTIPGGIVFEWDRLDAIKQIAKLWDAKVVVDSNGQLTLVTASSGDAIADFGVKINIAQWKSQSNSANLHNGVTFLGKDPVTGAELVGTATESDGLARWGGEFGYRPLRAASDLMSTQAAVDAAAQTRLATEIASRAVTQTCDALWHPGIELRDKPKLVLPDRDVQSEILGYSLPLAGGAMSVTLRLPVVL